MCSCDQLSNAHSAYKNVSTLYVRVVECCRAHGGSTLSRVRPRGFPGQGGGREVRPAATRGGQEKAEVRLMSDCEAHELYHVSQ